MVYLNQSVFVCQILSQNLLVWQQLILSARRTLIFMSFSCTDLKFSLEQISWFWICMQMLVYEFMSNGTLRDHLSGTLQLIFLLIIFQTFCSIYANCGQFLSASWALFLHFYVNWRVHIFLFVSCFHVNLLSIVLLCFLVL